MALVGLPAVGLAAAAEAGVALERLVVVERPPPEHWATVVGALVGAFDAARALGEPKPRVIICDTKMAKGVPFLETRDKAHFIRVEKDEWQPAIAALGEGRNA